MAKKETKLQELERRIKSLEDKTVIYVPNLPTYSPVNIQGVGDQFYQCNICGKRLPPNGTHVCPGYKVTC